MSETSRTNKLIKSSEMNVKMLLKLVFLATALSLQAREINLPKTEILGKEYYFYEVKKGESIYGIAKRYGWDVEELVRLNPEAASDLKKGSRLYYPTGQVTVVTDMSAALNPAGDFEREPIKHTVKKGETIYGIAKQYDMPLESIYKEYPSAKQGVKTGNILILPQNPNAKYYYYTIKPGDTLYSVARTYNTSVEELLKDNPGMSEKKFKVGEMVRVHVNSNSSKVQTKLVEEERLAKVENYKVSKNDTWGSISEKTGVEEHVLKEANNSDDKPQENQVITVPIVETIEIEREVGFEDDRELTSEGIQEIYDSIHGVAGSKEILNEVRVSLILDDPSSKKDIDFTRGFLIGLSELKDTPYRINLKVIDGRVAPNSLTDQLEDFEPNLIIATADKAFPLFLADYGNTENVQIVNVFDLKNDLYEDNSSMVQLLPPSSYFYEHLAGKLVKDNQGKSLLVVGEEDETDGMATELINGFNHEYEKMSIEDFSLYEPDILNPLLIYAYPTKKDEVGDFFQALGNIKETYPAVDMTVIGRSNWAALIDEYGDRFSENNVIVPARVWLDEESEGWDEFCAKYEEMFTGAPVRSFPNFAAGGYDSAHYFIPVIAQNGGDFNSGITGSNDFSLQTEINLNRVNNWGGFINTTGYLLRFHPEGRVERVVVK